jgi:hypothetical protein
VAIRRKRSPWRRSICDYLLRGDTDDARLETGDVVFPGAACAPR